MRQYLLLIILLCLVGCATFSPVKPVGMPADITNSVAASLEQVTSSSSMLNWLGALCVLGGMSLLILTKGSLGWRPAVGGVLLILLNFAVGLYASWIFLPVLVGTGAIALVWSWKIVKQIVNDDKIKIKDAKL